MAHLDSKTINFDEIPELFSKILHLWKDVPSHYDWAMEKLMEFYCKHVVLDPELVISVGFLHFVEGFIEACRLVQYPDFVMNNVALMAGETLLLNSPRLQDLKDPAFELIRHPLKFWWVDRGHSVDVTFQLYSKFLKHQVMLDKLAQFSFDVPKSLTFAIGSPQNYTRRSAALYFKDLVQFAWTHQHESSEMKTKLRSDIISSVKEFHNHLTCPQSSNRGMAGDAHKLTHRSIKIDVRLRYCHIICESANIVPEWGDVVFSNTIFDGVMNLCLQAAQHENGTNGDLYLTCTQSVLKKLNRCDSQSQEDKDLMVELSVVPLFVLHDVTPTTVLQFCPSLIPVIQIILDKCNMTTPCPMLKQAVNNLYTILDRKVSLCEGLSDLFAYMSFKVIAQPVQVKKPILAGQQVTSVSMVRFLEYSFVEIKNMVASSQLNAEHIQQVIETFLTNSQLSHTQIQAALDCYTHVVSNKSLQTLAVPSSLLHLLQMKMVDLDHNIQETAVKAASQLYLSGCLDMSLQEPVQCMKSVWQCVEYRSESVVTQVLQLLYHSSTDSKLKQLLSNLDISEEIVVSKTESFLLSSNWDNIKPVSFRLLSKLSTREASLQYAQVALKQYSSHLHLAVFEFVRELFVGSTDIQSSSVGQCVDRTLALVSSGWTDLLLDRSNTVETYNLRHVASILEHLQTFMTRDDVSHHVSNLASNMINIDRTESRDNAGITSFHSLCHAVLSQHGHTFNTQNKSCNEPPTKLKNVNTNADESEDTPAKKMKLDSGSSVAVVGGDSGIDTNIAKFLSFALSRVENSFGHCQPQKQSGQQESVDDQTLDSTTELPPLTLTYEKSVSQRLISMIEFPQDSASLEEMKNLLTWLVIKDVIGRIQPRSLSSEAERSTDEYERNCSMLLHDIHQLLDKSYIHLKEDVEAEFISLFLTKFSKLLTSEDRIKDHRDETELLLTWARLVQQIKVSTEHINSFSHFVADHRKSYLLPPSDVISAGFELDAFFTRLEALRCHDARLILTEDTYRGQDGLAVLLDLFIKTLPQTWDSSTDTEVKSLDLAAQQESADTADGEVGLKSKRKLLKANLQKLCQNFKESKSDLLERLDTQTCYYLNISINENPETVSNEEMIKEIMTEGKREGFRHILQLLMRLGRQIVISVFDDVEISKKKVAKSETRLAFEQLKNWFECEDDFDSDADNDPTALDCV